MKHYLISLFILSTILPFAIMADDKDDLIDKVIHAYGGDAVTSLKSYQIYEHYLGPATGQSHSPSITEINKTAVSLIVETETGRSAFDTLNTGRAGSFQGSTISDGKSAFNINFQNNTFGTANNADYRAFGGSAIRTSDAVLVYELNRVREEAILEESENHLNRPHKVITMPFTQSPDLHLYIDSETFLISKMVRVHQAFGRLSYLFSDYQQNNGITYASTIHFSLDGQPNLIGTKKEIKFNGAYPDSLFRVPAGFAEQGERIDTSTMSANPLSKRAVHVGENGAFSLFVNTSMGTIGVGGSAGLAQRYQHYQRNNDVSKPLTYQIITHHHADHLDGINDAVKLGAKAVTVAANVDVIAGRLDSELQGNNIISIDKRSTLGEGGGRVELFEISTIHADGYLLVYVPADKLLFMADHYGSPFATGLPTANQNSVDMLKAIDELGLDVKQIATAHNARIFTMKELRSSVKKFKPTNCSGNRPVCA